MALYLKNNEIASDDITASGVFKQKYNRDGLIIHLDATDKDSYPGTGSTWYDLSSLGNNFEINPSAFNTTSSVANYMDFNGSYGCAKKQNTDVAVSGNVTVCLWTRVKNSTAEWRTLLRAKSSGSDHQVIIQSGGWDIGIYDSVGSGFNGSGFSQQSLPGYPNDWVFMVWRFFNSESPYYELGYNDSASYVRGSINSVNARFKHGICSIGAYNNDVQNDVNNASQYWGDISMISVYNRILNPYEILENYNATYNNYFWL